MRDGFRRVRSRTATLTAIIGCLTISAIPLSSVAAAHVKWFVACEPSDQPIPFQTVLTDEFWLFAALFIVLFYLACRAEQTALGACLMQLLDRATGFLRNRIDVLLRGAAAVSFSLLWANGTLILTPELKSGGVGLSAIQALIPIYLAARPTLPAAAAGIVVLYGYGVATYGPFHMMDYPIYLGLAVYFALSVTDNPGFHALRTRFLRWTVALSLLWPAMEKFLYPAWIAPIAIEHPELTLGFDLATVTTAGGVVEFGLAFALFWTPLIRRLGALALALLLFAATFDFGKIDAIGHLMIIAVLLAVVAEPGAANARCRPVLALIASGTALLAAIFLYSGIHTLYYGSWRAALVPIMSGTALLAVISLYLPGVAHALLRIVRRPSPRGRLARDVTGARGGALMRMRPTGVVMPQRG